MNGYSKHELDEDAFGEKKKVGTGLKTFDAFRASPPSYLTLRRGLRSQLKPIPHT
jgi:hypothetical protein